MREAFTDKMNNISNRRTTTILLLVSLMSWQNEAFAPNHHPHVAVATNICRQQQSSSPLGMSGQQQQKDEKRQQEKEDGRTSAENFRKQAAKIRAQIAELEGKTLAQVEQEARGERRLKQPPPPPLVNNSDVSNTTTVTGVNYGRIIYVPQSIDEQVDQACAAIERAYNNNVTRQTIRFALVKKDKSMIELEEWPGGVRQMYREAGKPLVNALLYELRIKRQRLGGNKKLVTVQDIWDFDGSAIFTSTETASSSSNNVVVVDSDDNDSHESDRGGVVTALLFANTDTKYLKDIAKIDDRLGRDKLFLLVNPFWRNLDSWGFNVLAPNAKRLARSIIFDRGYEETYVFSRFSARGEKCVAIKSYPYDWQMFAYLEDDTNFGLETAIRLGSSEDEPTSAMFTELLNGRPEFRMTRNMRQMKKLF